jgi:hypothetical protein
MQQGLLEDLVDQNAKKITEGTGILAFPHYWQVPAMTEKVAYESIMSQGGFHNGTYLGFPWATLIDELHSNESRTLKSLQGLRAIWRHRKDKVPQGKIITVAQHIYSDKFIRFFQAVGVTDLFWSHALIDRPKIGGIRIHPFPLYPAQTPNGSNQEDLHRSRRWFANFIGAYNPKIYLTNVREIIFQDANSFDDILITRRDAWHFDRAVYDEQVQGIRPSEAQLAVETRHKNDYLQAIWDSTFTLCPTGSGPNSIRIGESLALGSIPIVLTQNLALSGDRSVWEAACLIEDDSVEGYRRALKVARSLSPNEVRRKQLATQDLYSMIGPENWGQLLTKAIDE